MTTSAEQVNRTAFHETLPDSDEVYTAVIKEALDYNLMGGEYGARAREFYTGMGVQRVELQSYNDDLGCHKGYDADQTVQLTGAYKDRAAAGAMLAVPKGMTKGDVASAGNAGAAYSRTGNVRGMDITVHCTTTASAPKLVCCIGYGAEVNATYDDFEEAQLGAAEKSRTTGSALLYPFDHESVIAGNATAGFEIVDDLLRQHVYGALDVHKDPIKLFVPVGGGGLIAGVAIAIKWAKEQGYIGEDNVQVIGVQMEGCDAMKRTVDYMQAGYKPPEDLFAEGLPFNANSDGTAVRKPGRLTTAIAADKTLVHDWMLVPEGMLGWEMLRQHDRTGKKYEPAGMLARTAAKKYAAAHADPEVLVTVTSGANVSDALFAKMTKAGLDYKLAEWSAESQSRNDARDALYALGGVSLKRPVQRTWSRDVGSAPEDSRPLVARASRGAVLRGSFVRGNFGS